MKVLVVGSGGREHALAWRLRRSPSVDEVLCAPGNPGMACEGTCHDVALSRQDDLVDLCRREQVGLVVVGPEVPLMDGLADVLRAAGFPVMGPNRSAAILEGSKAFTKMLCERFEIPTAAHRRFEDRDKALDYVETCDLPVVIKADGLAAGKGVVIAGTRAEAKGAVTDLMDGRFGTAGQVLVVEEFLEGEELSYFALTDGRVILPFGAAQDHKRVGDGDTGPNTGGMGAYSPALLMTGDLEQEILTRIIQPTVEGMARLGRPYEGVLYAGLMVTAQGPKLIEYNVRFGDPECQVLMMRTQGDFADTLLRVATHRLEGAQHGLSPETALTVVMASKGYPGSYAKDTEIRNLDTASAGDGVTVFHAGTRQDATGRILSQGGRVLNVSALGQTVEMARERAYGAVDRIDWPEGFCRRDIAWRALPHSDRETGAPEGPRAG